MTRAEIIEVIQEESRWLFVDGQMDDVNESRWLFVDGQMVDATTLESTSITQDNDLRCVDALLVGHFAERRFGIRFKSIGLEKNQSGTVSYIHPTGLRTFAIRELKRTLGEPEHLKEFISTHNLDVDYNCTVVKRIPKGLAGWYEAKIWNEETQNWVSEEIHLQAWLNSDDFLLYADGEKIDSETAYKDIIDRISKRRDTSIKVIVNSYCER